jgi:RimJ/RimL family protein N-acetyltransferase
LVTLSTPGRNEGEVELADATVGEQRGVFGIIDLATGVAIGSVHIGTDRRDVLELDYELLPSFWGQGRSGDGTAGVGGDPIG